MKGITLSEIDTIISNFEQQVCGLQVSSKNHFTSAKENLLTELKALQLQDPVLIPYSVDNDINDILRSISVAAESRGELQVVYAGGGGCKHIQGVCVDYPVFTNISGGFNVLINPFDTTNLAEIDNAERTLNQYLLHVLLSYPRGSVHVNFIDPDFTNIGDTFIKKLNTPTNAPICRLLQSQEEIGTLLQDLNKRIAAINKMGDRFYIDNPRYELVVLVNNPAYYQHLHEQLNLLLNKGSLFGIQFVLLSDINAPRADNNTFDILSRQDLFTIIDNDQQLATERSSVHYTTDLFVDEDVFEQCLDYLKNGLDGERSTLEVKGFTALPLIDDTTSPEQYFASLEGVVRKNVVVPYLHYNTYEAYPSGKFDIKPNQLPWQIENNRQKNIVINYTFESENHAIDLLNQIAMNLLLSLPVTKAHFTLINYNKERWARFLDNKIDDRIVEVIYDAHRVPMLCASLSKRLEEDSDTLGCSIEQKNLESKTIYRPYEIVVLNASDAIGQGEFVTLFKNGADSGIYFIVMNNTEELSLGVQSNNVLGQPHFIQTIDANADFYRSTPDTIVKKANIFSRDDAWRENAINYINKRSIVKVNHDWNAIANAPYPTTSPDMSVVIGYEQGTGNPVEFKLNITHSHYHSFVIGGTGSGKTSFLHNVVLSLALKYKPEDLELYLIDLKGPEFGRYKQLQQAGAVLVDKTDEVITYEVIGNLVKKMLTRKELFADNGGDLASYNQIHPENPLPQILLIVDECQNLFNGQSENNELERKIINAITLIATEGRAFGVHLLMATQSLSNCPKLPEGVLTQFQDFYVLPCVDTDAKMLVKAEHKEEVGREANRMEREKEINRGQCFLCGTDGNRRFKFNYISDNKQSIEETSQLERLIQQSVEKASGHISNGQVFFSGSQNYSLYENTNNLTSPNAKYLIASAGQNISFAQEPNLIHLMHEQGNNILTMGYNDQQFVTRATIDILLSLILSSRKNALSYRFVVINCLGMEGGKYSSLLQRLADGGYCEVIDQKDSGKILKSLCGAINSDYVEPTILTILCQEKFALLKNDEILFLENVKHQETTQTAPEQEILPGQHEFDKTIDLMMSIPGDISQSAPTELITYRDALRFVLQRGSEYGVHTLLQVNKASELALTKKYTDNIEVYKFFEHIVFLQTDKDTELFFSLSEMELHKIQESENRLRAYYYKPNGGSLQLFSPYMFPTKRIQKGTSNDFEFVLDIEATMNEITRNY